MQSLYSQVTNLKKTIEWSIHCCKEINNNAILRRSPTSIEMLINSYLNKKSLNLQISIDTQNIFYIIGFKNKTLTTIFDHLKKNQPFLKVS